MKHFILEKSKGRSVQEWKDHLQLECEKAHRAIHGFTTKEQAIKFAESVS
jgi:hypothetical protein